MAIFNSFVSSFHLVRLCRQENLTCDEPEPKVPAVIIERLRLPGGIGGAANTVEVWYAIWHTQSYNVI